MRTETILAYEIGSSWWAPLVSWGWGQSVAGSYFAWKVRRKLRRYDANKAMRERLDAKARGCCEN